MQEMNEPNESPKVNPAIWKKVDEWKKYHNDQQRTEMDFDKWEDNYLNVDEYIIEEIILVAEYLKIERLVELAQWKLSTSSRATNNKEVLRFLNTASAVPVEYEEERELQAEIKRVDDWYNNQ
ncbi:hypothetical protein CLU79DRAFT_736664 [Phycomyces nitens]|nr:hypothetical protein CLU79DRAFT_736664 [Phycomyces nitens]